MLALGSDGIESIEDHDAFLRVGEAISILARYASFLSWCLFAVSFRRVGLSEETFEELIVFVKVFDRVGLVGA